MYKTSHYSGKDLPYRTLCLTFDDGPGVTEEGSIGPQTIKLAEYLHQENIKGTFFVVGKHAVKFPEALKKLRQYGHLIGNHSFDHKSLPTLIPNPNELIEQIIKTDRIISEWVDSPITFVRPPWGNWTNVTACKLNADLLASLNHFGPILWDNKEGEDWRTYQDNGDMSKLVDDYYNYITDVTGNNHKQNGIILMHDSSGDNEGTAAQNRCLELVQMLIPKLKAEGFNFVRLDEIQEIMVDAKAELRFALKGANGKYVSPQDGGGYRIYVNGPQILGWEPLIAINLGDEKIAIRTVTGAYISPQGGGGSEVYANGPAVLDFEHLKVIRINCGQVAFRTINGYYLTLDTNGDYPELKANAKSIGNSEIFEFEQILA